jgi:predicted metal-dependent hydrolase
MTMIIPRPALALRAGIYTIRMSAASEYDDRYLVGIDCFNRGDYFEAHETWEDLWLDCPGADRRFYQSLIQAAVALYHWRNGNHTGARRLFAAGREKMADYQPRHHGLDCGDFWRQVEAALAGALTDAPPADPAPPPRIELHPPT